MSRQICINRDLSPVTLTIMSPVVLRVYLQGGDAHSETLGLIICCDVMVTKQNLNNEIIRFPIVEI